MISFRKLAGLLTLVATLSLAACGSPSNGAAHHFTIGLTYKPDIQFAPFYVAAALGYYRDAGLDVTLHHHSFSDSEFGGLETGQENGAIAAGDEVLTERDKGGSVVYLAPIYTQNPVTLIVPANSPIHTAADLRGHSIGVPGPYGGTYIGLLELLQQGGLTPADVNIQYINFTQVAALLSHHVDAVMGYLNNEPLLLQQGGMAVRTIPVFPAGGPTFLSNGLVATQAELKDHPDDVKKFIAATLRGEAYVIAHPDDALRLSQQYVTVLADPAQRATAKSILMASLPLWQNAGQPMDAATWQNMITFMHANGFLKSALNPADCYSNAYLP